MHFDVAGVLGPIPPTGICVDEVTHSLEHQNLRVESAVPGYHALLLEHQRLSGHSDDEEDHHDGAHHVLHGAHEEEFNDGHGLASPLLPPVRIHS